MPTKKVTTATLVRGQLYSWRNPKLPPTHTEHVIRFEKGKPVVIEDAAVARMLEDEVDVVQDGDGEEYEKPRFRIDRNVSVPTEEDQPRRRLAPGPSVKRRRIA